MESLEWQKVEWRNFVSSDHWILERGQFTRLALPQELVVRNEGKVHI
jgi:hypothetical protein